MESVVKQRKDKTKINKTFLCIFKLFIGRFNEIIYYPKFINSSNQRYVWAKKDIFTLVNWDVYDQLRQIKQIVKFAKKVE